MIFSKSGRLSLNNQALGSPGGFEEFSKPFEILCWVGVIERGTQAFIIFSMSEVLLVITVAWKPKKGTPFLWCQDTWDGVWLRHEYLQSACQLQIHSGNSGKDQ